MFPNLFRNVKRKYFPLGDHYITSQSFFFLLIMYCYEKLMLKTFGTWGVNYIYIQFWWFCPRNVVQSTECPFKVINLANLHHKHLNQGVPKPISDCNNNNNNNKTYIVPISILLFSPALKNKNISTKKSYSDRIKYTKCMNLPKRVQTMSTLKL